MQTDSINAKYIVDISGFINHIVLFFILNLLTKYPFKLRTSASVSINIC